MAKGQAARSRQAVVDFLVANKGVATLGAIARAVGLKPEQLKTVMGQLKGQVECASKAGMDSEKSMNWFHVDSRWRLVS